MLLWRSAVREMGAAARAAAQAPLNRLAVAGGLGYSALIRARGDDGLDYKDLGSTQADTRTRVAFGANLAAPFLLAFAPPAVSVPFRLMRHLNTPALKANPMLFAAPLVGAETVACALAALLPVGWVYIEGTTVRLYRELMDRLLVIESKAPKDEVFLSRTRVKNPCEVEQPGHSPILQGISSHGEVGEVARVHHNLGYPSTLSTWSRDAQGNEIVYKCGGKLNALREAALNALREGIRPFREETFRADQRAIKPDLAICFFLDHILCESTEDEIKLLSNQLGKELQLYQSGLMHVLGNCGQSTPLFCNCLSKCIHFAYLMDQSEVLALWLLPIILGREAYEKGEFKKFIINYLLIH